MNISQEPLISVIVPTYQRYASVECLLLALIHQTMPAENYEVIVVVDVSMDGTHEMIEQSQSPFKLMTIWQPNQGRATACNLGIREAEGSLVVILDDDMEPSAQLMDAHWDAHQAGIRIGVLGAVPIRLEPTLPPMLQCIGEKFNEHLEKKWCLRRACLLSLSQVWKSLPKVIIRCVSWWKNGDQLIYPYIIVFRLIISNGQE